MALAEFNPRDPQTILGAAQQLAKFIADNKLASNIQGRAYVQCEGWQFLFAVAGLDVICAKPVRLVRANEQEICYEAEARLYDSEGREVGYGYALCSDAERLKKGWAEYAIASMAQTRAIGKAGRNRFAFVMKAAGFEPTPAEEMSDVGEAAEATSQVPASPSATVTTQPKKVLFTADEAIKAVLAIESGEKLKAVWENSNLAQHKQDPIFGLVCQATSLRWLAPEYQSPEQADKEVASRAQRDLAHKLLASSKNDAYRLEALHLLNDAGMPWVVCTQLVDKAMANTKKGTAPQPQRAVEITASTTRPTTDEQGQPIAYATPAQKQEIISLLNHPKVTRQEKAKMLESINRLTEERAVEAIAKLNKAITDREGSTAIAA